MVFLIYGVGEFVLALIMFKTLERDKLELVKSYTTAIKNRRVMMFVVILLFVGAAILGSFTYTRIAVK